jgi:WD40 repeat protein/tRNA A-37 threonylcarbamoyl transferase component Bud32
MTNQLTQLGKYQIKEFLGRGAMAQVYKAFHPTLERDVAIKVIHPYLADDPDFVDRFRREAKIIAALRHPGIIQVHDFEIEGNRFYTVMEFVPGESLQEHLAALRKRGERMGLDQALHLFQSIVQTVAYAHNQGIVHRDLKPSNVLLTSKSQPVLADFGLSRIVGTERLFGSGAIVGTPTYMSPEQGEGAVGDERSDIYSLGVMLYELATGIPPFSADSPISIILKHLDEPLPPPRLIRADLPTPVEQVIQKALEKDPADRYQSAQELLEALDEITLPKIVPDDQVRPLDMRCPYRGLQVFEEEHAEFFFGREALVGQLVKALEPVADAKHSAAQFLAVLGASGSGKSSLVRAGLVPALRAGAIAPFASNPGSSEWAIEVIKPGSHPLEELAAHLAPVVTAPVDQLRDEFAAHGRALHLAARRAWSAESPERRLVLVVDQFEEVFTLCHDEAERAGFIENLLYATAVGDGQLIVILAMRADFYHRCAAYRDLARRISARQVLVGPMHETELRRAIEQPAQRVGLQFEPGLVDIILADVARQPGALPLLQHALLELWERRQGRALTLSAYEASGGVAEAIARRADSVYDGLGLEKQAIVRRIMLRLTQPGEGTEDTRRRARKRELMPRSEEQQSRIVEEVLHRLADARLIVTSRDAASEEEMVDVAHEALIRSWARLQSWINENRMALHTHRQLTETAETWEQENRDASFLYRGVRLAQAREWAETRASDLNELEQAFLDASRATAEAREREREAARQRELAQAQALAEAEHQRAEVQIRASRRLRWLAAGLAVVFLAAVGAAVWARGEQQRAQAAAELSQSLALATNTQLALNEENTDLALALALEANRITNPPPQARRILAEAAYVPSTRHVLTGHTAPVQSVVVSLDGHAALSASADGTLILWDLETDKIRRRLEGHSDAVHDGVLLHDDRQALSASADGTLILWNTETGDTIRRFIGHEGSVISVAVGPDQHTALSGSADGTLILWDLETGDVIRRFAKLESPVYSVAISSDGRTALSGSADGTVCLWDLETGEIVLRIPGQSTLEANISPEGEVQPLQGHFGEVWDVAFLSDDHTAISVSQDEYLILWNLETGARVNASHMEMGLLSVTPSADGRTALVGTLSNQLILLDLSNGQPLLRLHGHAGRVLSTAFIPAPQTGAGSRRALSASADGTLRVWNLQSGAEVRRLDYAASTIAVTDVDISPDGQRGLVAFMDNEIHLWDVVSGSEICRLEGHTDMPFAGVAFLPDGHRAVSGSGDIFAPSDDNTVRLWDLGTCREIHRFEGHTDKLWDIAVGPDGRQVASGAHDGTLRLWDIESGEGRVALDVSPQAPRSVAFSPDGTVLAVGLAKGSSATPDYGVRLVAPTTGQELRRLAGHVEVVADLAFSPDGQRLLSGSTDGDLILWDIASGTILHHLSGHTDAVLAVAYHPDGHLAASGSSDASVILWDTESGESLRRYWGHDKAVLGLAFSPDGETLFSGGDQSSYESVREWRVDASQEDLQDWIAVNRYVPELTCEQRERYHVEPLCENERDS